MNIKMLVYDKIITDYRKYKEHRTASFIHKDSTIQHYSLIFNKTLNYKLLFISDVWSTHFIGIQQVSKRHA